MKNLLQRSLLITTVAFIIMVVTLMWAMPVLADPTRKAEKIVSDALSTVQRMINHDQHGAMIRDAMRQAKAVVIFPKMLKGGFIVGGEGGYGLLLARAENGEWSYPGFYGTAAGSVGFQFGASFSEMLLILKTSRALQSFMKTRTGLGGELNVAAGKAGFGIQMGSTTATEIDIHSFTLAEGAFLGVGVEGLIFYPIKNYNAAFYANPTATSRDIILDARYRNPKADPLRNYLQSVP